MARIQVLELPSEQVGDFKRTPFALVIDRCDSVEIQSWGGGTVDEIGEYFDPASLKENSRAKFVIVTSRTLDVA